MEHVDQIKQRFLPTLERLRESMKEQLVERPRQLFKMMSLLEDAKENI